MKKLHHAASRRRGSAIIPALIIAFTMAGLTVALLGVGMGGAKSVESSKSELRALYMAEAGVSDAIVQLTASGVVNTAAPTALGSSEEPVSMGQGGYWTDIESNGDGSFTLTSMGTVGNSTRAIQVVVIPNQVNVFSSAIFAGNSSNDPNYTLRFSGLGAQGDIVRGDVFSGGNVEVAGDATITGDTRAQGTVSGVVGVENVVAAPPDLIGMRYETKSDYYVADEFASHGSYKSSTYGGSAYQVPESNPAHIFRLNPSDRKTEVLGTDKDDYFLEDPYETLRTDSKENGSDASALTLTGDGSGKIYYIDGNLWVHNKKSYSFKLKGDKDGAQVTFVVKGNVYFSDNVFLNDTDNDGIAFIAMTDDKVEDSGNIYFGDPEFGTLSYMSAFMYAENNFYDYNLDESGSAQVTVRGNMTAGNQVNIERDFKSQHSRLTIDFDSRLVTSDLELPGLPGWDTGGVGYSIVSWREVSARYVGASAGVTKHDNIVEEEQEEETQEDDEGVLSELEDLTGIDLDREPEIGGGGGDIGNGGEDLQPEPEPEPKKKKKKKRNKKKKKKGK